MLVPKRVMPKGGEGKLTCSSSERVIQDATSGENVLAVTLGERLTSNFRVFEFPASLDAGFTLPAHTHSVPTFVFTLC